MSPVGTLFFVFRQEKTDPWIDVDDDGQSAMGRCPRVKGGVGNAVNAMPGYQIRRHRHDDQSRLKAQTIVALFLVLYFRFFVETVIQL